ASNVLPTATKTLGVYVQEQAAIRDRMFLTLALRSDQNSAFGTNFQNVVYPKASLSWILSDESYFPKWNWMNQFRLRSAYGASGVQPGSTSSLITLASTIVNINRTETPGIRTSTLGNPDLKPETSAEFEGGFETRLFNNRVNLDATYYSKKTKDALIAKPIAPSAASPATSVIQNLGSVKNAGFELSLTTTIIDRPNFGWDVTVGGSHNANKIVSLGMQTCTVDPVTCPNGEKPNATIGTGGARDSLGFPVNGWFYRPFTYNDANGDGRIAASEVTVDSIVQYRGYSTPRDMVSLQSGVDLFKRQLRVNVSLDHKGGYSLNNGTYAFQCQSQHQNCYDSSNLEASLYQQARVVALVNKNPNTSGGFLENGSFWRLREISATWTVPNRLASQLRAKDASFTFGARNLKLWTKYGGIDPEANYSTGATGTAEVQNEFSTTAPPRYYTVRLNLHY
ncbi:MAG TPA: TonB-dependent receptor, partial [Gemmatimonadaceae bacterium]